MITSRTSRTEDIIRTVYSAGLDVPERIFAVLYVDYGLTRCYKNSSGDEIANVLVKDDIAHT